MAITVKKKKDQPFYRVTNEFDDSDTTWGCRQRIEPEYTGRRDQVQLSVKDLQDPFEFMWDGVKHVLERGTSEVLKEGVVKHLVGDWDLKNEDLWAADQRRLISSFGFIPKLKMERLLTEKEKEEKAERYKAKSRYIRPEIGEVKAQTAPKIPEIIEDEDTDKGFTEEALDEAEKKKPGRPKKKAD